MPYAKSFKDERIDELNYENRELKDINDSLQDELRNVKKTSSLSKIKSQNSEKKLFTITSADTSQIIQQLN